MTRPPLVLMILDGVGERDAAPDNAVTQAHPEYLDQLRREYPFTLLQASGQDVGLPDGLMGNSEVGHLNIGAGRVVWQEITRIDRTIADGSFRSIPALRGAMEHAKENGSTLHLMGLVSNGEVHSSDRHLHELVRTAADVGLAGDQLAIHAFTDGRDTAPRCAQQFLDALEDLCRETGCGRIASVIGRYYGMDRDQRWERVRQAYDCLTLGAGERADSPAAAVAAAYERGEGDEFILPTVIGTSDRQRLQSGDAVFFFNYRADRARQLSIALNDSGFDGFPRTSLPKVHYATMTRYREDFPYPVAFAPQTLEGTLGEVVSAAGLRQLRIAETEKYPHVTYFFSGGDEQRFSGEERILVASPKVATYDEQPEMSAGEVTDKLLRALGSDEAPEVVILNYANGDMVGHTGDLQAATAAMQTLDACMQRVIPAVLGKGGTVCVTADHGNCELMTDPDTGKPHTAHTTNPVPFILVGDAFKGRQLKSGGRLCDIATTMIARLGLQPSAAMDGVDLLEPTAVMQ